MSHIDNITRATKAYHILAEGTNYHLDLVEMIERLYHADGHQLLIAAGKALTGRSIPKGAPPSRLMREFFHALDITGNSYQEKINFLNEFGNDIRLEDEENYRNEIHTYGAPYEHAQPSGARS